MNGDLAGTHHQGTQLSCVFIRCQVMTHEIAPIGPATPAPTTLLPSFETRFDNDNSSIHGV